MTLTYFSFDELQAYYLEGFAKLFGKVKAKQVWDKIYDSTKINDFISRFVMNSIIPKKQNFEDVFNTIGYFIFSKPETHTLGLVIFILRYVKEGDSISTSAGEEYMRIMVKEIIEEAKVSYVITHSDLYNKEIKNVNIIQKAEIQSKPVKKSESEIQNEKKQKLLKEIEELKTKKEQTDDVHFIIELNCMIAILYHRAGYEGYADQYIDKVLKTSKADILQAINAGNESIIDVYIKTLILGAEYKYFVSDKTAASRELKKSIDFFKNYLPESYINILSNHLYNMMSYSLKEKTVY